MRMVDARENEEGARVDPSRAVELASVMSKTLGQIARSTNKESINLYAELILRTLGKERGRSVPAPDPKKARTPLRRLLVTLKRYTPVRGLRSERP